MKKWIVSAMMALCATLAVAPAAGAMDLFNGCTGAGCGVVNDTSLQQDSAGFKVRNIVNLAIYILGGLAVVMIIVNALKIITANGDADHIKTGRDGIMWAVVGVAVAVLAYAIVNFVVNWKWTT